MPNLSIARPQQTGLTAVRPDPGHGPAVGELQGREEVLPDEAARRRARDRR